MPISPADIVAQGLMTQVCGERGWRGVAQQLGGTGLGSRGSKLPAALVR